MRAVGGGVQGHRPPGLIWWYLSPVMETLSPCAGPAAVSFSDPIQGSEETNTISTSPVTR